MAFLWLGAIFMLLSAPRISGGIRFDSVARSWEITSGPTELRLKEEGASVAINYIGPANGDAWPPTFPRRFETDGIASAFSFEPSSLKLHSYESRKLGLDVEELQFNFKHQKFSLELALTYTSWASTGVLTRRVQLANTGSTGFLIESCPVIQWKLPGSEYELQYLWGTHQQRRQVAVEILPRGRRQFHDPDFAPWFSLRNLTSGHCLVAHMPSADTWQMEFERPVGRLPNEGLAAQVSIPLKKIGFGLLQAGSTLELPIIAFISTHGDVGEAIKAMHRYQRQFLYKHLVQSAFQFSFSPGKNPFVQISPAEIKSSLDFALELGTDIYAIDEGWDALISDSVEAESITTAAQMISKYLADGGVKLAANVDLISFPSASAIVVAHPHWFLSNSNNMPVLHNRVIMDFRQPDARSLASLAIKRLISSGVRHISFTPAAKALHQHMLQSGNSDLAENARAWASWVETMRDRHPNILFHDSQINARQLALHSANRSVATSGEAIEMRDISSEFMFRRASLTEFCPDIQESILESLFTNSYHSSPLTVKDGLELPLALAMNGSLAVVGNPTDFPPTLVRALNEKIAIFKEVRPFLRGKDIYHLSSMPKGRGGSEAFQYVSSDGKQSILLVYWLPHSRPEQTFALRGLLSYGTYQVEGNADAPQLIRADKLAYAGLDVRRPEGVVKIVKLSWKDANPFIRINGRDIGRTFEGIGALSAGGSSRLLFDYPEPSRSNILDFLFKPLFGAGFQHLKVEIGGDVNSTAGCEPSHMPTRFETNFLRGHQWWLMKEAKKRNASLPLDALQWGAPAWVGAGHLFSEDNANYLVEFLRGAEVYHGLTIDFLGSWNEMRYDPGWIKLLRKTLNKNGLEKVKIVAPDEVNRWSIASLMESDDALSQSVDVIGVHYPQFKSTPLAKSLEKPLWASEDGPWRGDWEGARQLAKLQNRNYIEGKITKTIVWSPVTGYYDNLPIPSSGVMRANEPWSGHFEVQPALWTIAHTTQFAQPGWNYIDSVCGYLPLGGSIVTLLATNRSDFSLIVETVDALKSQTITFALDGGLSARKLHVWRSSEDEQFVPLPDLLITNGVFVVTFEPASIYSLTTTSGQHHGNRSSLKPLEFPRDYVEEFDLYEVGVRPRFFSDQGGAFEIARRVDDRGQCLRQMVTNKGVEWENHLNPFPETFLGNANWRNYTVSVDTYLPCEGFVSLFGRVGIVPQSHGPPQAYWLRVNHTGFWDLGIEKHPIASGHVLLNTNEWHNLQMQLEDKQITIFIDRKIVASVMDQSYFCGMVGIGSGWHRAEFDNLRVKVATSDANLALRKPVRASSSAGVDHSPSNINDGNAFTTRWTAKSDRLSVEWLEIDFGRVTSFNMVAFKAAEVIPNYEIQFLKDEQWIDLAQGESLATQPRLVTFPRVTTTKAKFNFMGSDSPALWELEVYDESSLK